jgi:hypothetical protein
MGTLEFTCFDCGDGISMEVSHKDHEYYMDYGYFREGSDAHYCFFDTFGWILQSGVYCDICKCGCYDELNEDAPNVPWI